MSLLDGHVVALEQHTGRVVWTFDSGAPLVSAKQSFSSSQGLNVFPGTDGGLYTYHGLTHLNPGLEVRHKPGWCCDPTVHSAMNISATMLVQELICQYAGKAAENAMHSCSWAVSPTSTTNPKQLPS